MKDCLNKFFQLNLSLVDGLKEEITNICFGEIVHCLIMVRLKTI